MHPDINHLTLYSILTWSVLPNQVHLKSDLTNDHPNIVIIYYVLKMYSYFWRILLGIYMGWKSSYKVVWWFGQQGHSNYQWSLFSSGCWVWSPGNIINIVLDEVVIICACCAFGTKTVTCEIHLEMLTRHYLVLFLGWILCESYQVCLLNFFYLCF